MRLEAKGEQWAAILTGYINRDPIRPSLTNLTTNHHVTAFKQAIYVVLKSAT